VAEDREQSYTHVVGVPTEDDDDDTFCTLAYHYQMYIRLGLAYV